MQKKNSRQLKGKRVCVCMCVCFSVTGSLWASESAREKTRKSDSSASGEFSSGAAREYFSPHLALHEKKTHAARCDRGRAPGAHTPHTHTRQKSLTHTEGTQSNLDLDVCVAPICSIPSKVGGRFLSEGMPVSLKGISDEAGGG